MPKEEVQDRYIEKNEFLLSLRTASYHIPWINKIHIITDNQYPYWMNFTNTKINFVSHKTLFGNDAALFNSNSIQFGINRIPGLANKFIIADDDVFWTKNISKLYYFNNDRPIIQIDKHPKTITRKFHFGLNCEPNNNGQIYFHSIFNAFKLIQIKYPRFPTPKFNYAHTSFLYTLKLFNEAIKEFPIVQEQIKYKFRTCDMIQFQSFLTYYAVAKKAADTIVGDYILLLTEGCDSLAKQIIERTIDKSSVCMNYCDAESISKIINFYPKSEYKKNNYQFYRMKF